MSITETSRLDYASDERGGWTSASNAQADALCPGRHKAQAGIPEESPSEDAQSGTRIHAWLAAKATNSPLPDLVDHERDTAERCWEQAQATISAWAGSTPYTVQAETRHWMSYGSVKHSGKSDLVCRADTDAGRKYLVIDYKSGRGRVEDPASNLQLRDLACLLEDDPISVTVQIISVTVQIIQPLAGTSTPCEYDFGDLLKATKEMIARVLASNDPNAKRIPGPVQCQWCRAKRVCPEYAAQLAVVPHHSLAAMAPADLGRWLAVCRDVGAAAEAEVRRLLGMGIEVPGWTLKPGHTTTKIVNPQGVWSRCDGLGVQPDAFMGAVKVQTTALRSVLKSATGKKGKDLDALLDDVLAGNVAESIGEPRLARLT